MINVCVGSGCDRMFVWDLGVIVVCVGSGCDHCLCRIRV